jgi:hypothetical protein
MFAYEPSETEEIPPVFHRFFFRFAQREGTQVPLQQEQEKARMAMVLLFFLDHLVQTPAPIPMFFLIFSRPHGQTLIAFFIPIYSVLSSILPCFLCILYLFRVGK